MQTTAYRTKNPYEALFGYSRAVRRGSHIFVSGTTSLSPHSATPIIQHPGDAYHQTLAALTESISAIEKLGGTKEDVVRVRLFVARHEDCDDVGRGMKEVLADGNGAWAATMIVGVAFVREEMLVEVEVDAVVL
ncbi:YjgF-like protein [Sphaerosporella brunnea]|uniref:YjgF-like protein n=1 Tax=Sphaerosporella brunnea TaxID=1250544 RepID=A0A5J5F149_9PEZI|nr:YjgF-like protein [Sphaerosporella brunnea]